MSATYLRLEGQFPPFDVSWLWTIGRKGFRTITLKTVFLLSLATAARVCVLRGIVIVVFAGSTSQIVHHPIPGFHHKPKGPWRHLVIQSEHSAYTFRFQLHSAKYGRGSSFFLLLRPTQRPPILRCSSGYIQWSSGPTSLPACILLRCLNPHDMRAVYSMMALHSNCLLNAIMEGCFWKLGTVFASHFR